MRGSESLSLVCKGDGVVHIMDHQAGCVRLVEQTVAVVSQPPAQWQQYNVDIRQFRGMFPRVFGDEFGDKFGDEFDDEFSELPNLVIILVMNLVMNLVNCQIR